MRALARAWNLAEFFSRLLHNGEGFSFHERRRH
ncbi:hypothetical protein N234_21880 [Ralstonia pickettii DTP0602]|nr:hypothetical protein N234_21880 [Ralstonia pickettii DTP0602]